MASKIAERAAEGVFYGGAVSGCSSCCSLILVSGALLAALIYNAIGLTAGWSHPGFENALEVLKYSGMVLGGAVFFGCLSKCIEECNRRRQLRVSRASPTSQNA